VPPATNEIVSFLERAVAALATDLKVLLRAVQDENLDDGLRREAVGAVLYTISAGDLVPDSLGVLGYADDALVCRMALQRIGAKEASWRERYPRLYDRLDEDLAAARAFLGDELYDFVGTAATTRTEAEYKGKTARDFLDDPEASGWLADEVSAQSVKLSFRRVDLERELKKIDQILPRLRQKLEASQGKK
jgi:uncharacterized membrane protein YkvA (DUF1232 family)